MVNLVRIDAVPLQSQQFTPEFERWLANLVDSINETIQQLEDLFNNGLTAPSKTTAEITALAATMPNGTLWYDTDTNQIKAKSNGIVVVVV